MKKLLIAAITILSTHQLMSNDVSWSFPPTTISSGSVNASDPQIATDSSGDVVAAWVEAGQVKAATKVVNMSWSSASTISGINASCHALRLIPTVTQRPFG